MAPGNEPSGTRAVVIGGGIVGACCGYALRRQGFDVTVIERHEPGRAASFGNSGSIGLASVPPLGMPGMLRDLPSMLLNRDHALAIRWRHLPRSLPWFLKFAAALKPERVQGIADARAALLKHAPDAYDAMLDEIGRPDLIRRDGLIFAYESPAAFAIARAGIELRRERGIALAEMSGDALRELEPTLSDRVTAGVHYPDVRTTLNPLMLTEAVMEAFLARGGRLLRQSVQGFTFGPDGPTEVLTDGGRHPVDLVVVAAGVWSRDLAAQLGDRVLLEAERGYHIVLKEPVPHPRVPILAGDDNVAITSMADGLRMTTIAEFTTPEAPAEHARPMRLFRKAARFIRGLDAVEPASRWIGSRPSTPNSLPVIGRATRYKNVLYAFGHGHLGVTFAAVTGRIVGQLARGDRPNLDLAPYRPDRDFGGAHVVAQRGAAPQ